MHRCALALTACARRNRHALKHAGWTSKTTVAYVSACFIAAGRLFVAVVSCVIVVCCDRLCGADVPQEEGKGGTCFLRVVIAEIGYKISWPRSHSHVSGLNSHQSLALGKGSSGAAVQITGSLVKFATHMSSCDVLFQHKPNPMHPAVAVPNQYPILAFGAETFPTSTYT